MKEDEKEGDEEYPFQYLEDGLLGRERIIHYFLEEERIFKLLIKAARKRCIRDY